MRFRRKIKPHNIDGGLFFIEVRFGLKEAQELLDNIEEFVDPNEQEKIDHFIRGLRKQVDHMKNYQMHSEWEEQDDS
jgi:hypothetical protein